MRLPVIELEQITTLSQAINVIEQLLQTQRQLEEELQRAQEEVSHLKGQPKKPTFSSFGKRKQYASVINLL